MRKFLLATHGQFAEGIYDSLEKIIGEQTNVSTLCAYTEDDFDINRRVEEIVSSISDEDELIIITDIYGGSINNEFMMYLSLPNIYLISGLNLSLVIELVLSQETDTEKMINDALDVSKKSIKFCNPLLDLGKIKDEEF